MQSYEEMLHFVDTESAKQAVIHFIGTCTYRIASGPFSSKGNRDFPPLRYDDVYRLKHRTSKPTD